MFSDASNAGWLVIGRYHGSPIRIHWSAPLGMFVFCGLQVAPVAWLGFFLIVLWHELGHAVLVRRFDLHVVGIDIHGLGGTCHWRGYPTALQRSTIAWGGVLAQAVMLAVAVPLSMYLESGPITQELFYVFTVVNIRMIVINLLPFAPLDGGEAWPVFEHWRAARRRRPSVRPKRDVQRERRAPTRAVRFATLDDADRLIDLAREREKRAMTTEN